MTGSRVVTKRHLDWPVSSRAYLTLDFECDYGTALAANYYNAVRQSSQLAELLEAHDVPMSCFLQTEILDTCPESVDPFLTADVSIDFHAHSHTHPARGTADVEHEVAESVGRVRREFGTDPIGFRFPDGAAKPRDYKVLTEHNVTFSSSMFPSWRPGRFNHLTSSPTPHEVPDSGVVELPFTVYSDYLRVPVSLSYLKLFGTAYERLVMANPPDVIVFDLHMHDLVVPPTYSELSIPYQAVYARRKYEGMEILDRFIQQLRERGYTFGQMADLYLEVVGTNEQ